MHKDKPPHKPYKKFRLLLDAPFAKPNAFSKLCKKAVQEKRFILTINFKDFKKLVKPGKSGVIAIESQLSNAEIDEIVTKFVSTKNPDDFIGKAIKI